MHSQYNAKVTNFAMRVLCRSKNTLFARYFGVDANTIISDKNERERGKETEVN